MRRRTSGAQLLGSHLQLSAHMVPGQLPNEFAALVRHHIVIADARTDKDLFHPRDRPQGP